ncbi:MAG: thioredoxin family protein [Candidatus Aenigmarchaeota archaeon]|nr:thioredoxin family protein [Candidatus Aenigmarchaeota archaeon]
MMKGFAMNSLMIGIVVIIIIAVGGALFYSQTYPTSRDITQPDGTILKPDGTMVKPDGTMIAPDGTMTKPDGTMVEPEEAGGSMVIAGSTTKYLKFDKAAYEKALADKKAVYLYFYANWCPICRAERPNILQAFNELSEPEAVGFEVHFNDNELTPDQEAMARQFGVAYQHTTIIIGKDGKETFRSLNPISEDEIKQEITKAATA